MSDLGPEWRRVLKAAAAALERERATFSITDPDTAERHLISGITGKHRSAAVKTVRVALADLDAYTRSAFDVGLTDLVKSELGIEIGAARRRRAERDRARSEVLARAETCRHRDEPWFRTWLGRQTDSGTITRLANEGGDLTDVCAVLDALPAVGEPLPVFAERVLGDTKALGPGRVRGLVLSALAAWADTDRPTTAESERDLLEWAGLTPDDLSSQVLVLNLPTEGGIVGEWMSEAAERGIPLRLTLHQLRLTELHCRAERLFVCENPAVLRLAAERLGSGSAPLVCTEGTPAAAVHRLLASAPDAEIHWRNDFDWTGLRLTGAALRRYVNASPWRMSAADYNAGIGGIALTGAPVLAPWDRDLSDAMASKGRAVMEEAILGPLLADLEALDDESQT